MEKNSDAPQNNDKQVKVVKPADSNIQAVANL